MVESVIGLFKTEVINDLGPWKSMAQVEWETLNQISWYNTERLPAAIGHRPPQEVEDASLAEMNTLENTAQVLNRKASGKPWTVQIPETDQLLFRRQASQEHIEIIG